MRPFFLIFIYCVSFFFFLSCGEISNSGKIKLVLGCYWYTHSYMLKQEHYILLLKRNYQECCLYLDFNSTLVLISNILQNFIIVPLVLLQNIEPTQECSSQSNQTKCPRWTREQQPRQSRDPLLSCRPLHTAFRPLTLIQTQGKYKCWCGSVVGPYRRVALQKEFNHYLLSVLY